MKIIFLYKNSSGIITVLDETLSSDQLLEFTYIRKVKSFNLTTLISLVDYFYDIDLNPYDLRTVLFEKDVLRVYLKDYDYKKIIRDRKIDNLLNI